MECRFSQDNCLVARHESGFLNLVLFLHWATEVFFPDPIAVRVKLGYDGPYFFFSMRIR
jgi:hypothetical protein